MSGYKEFEGKTLDEAIRDACSYYDTTRDKLEIDILNDAKGGIFGLVGVKKARVRARLVMFSSVFDDLDSLGEKSKTPKKRPEASACESPRHGKCGVRDETPRQGRSEKAISLEADAPQDNDIHVEPLSVVPMVQPEDSSGSRPLRPAKALRRDRPREGRRGRNSGGRQENGNGDAARHAALPAVALAEIPSMDIDLDGEDFSRVPIDQLDVVALENTAREIISRLTVSFLGEVTITVAITNDLVRITLTDVEDPGLLIGRDGQTLASLQYLITRMLCNRMNALLRVQIDAGDYRERQDERLREMALQLAEKVKAGGRPQVTRPLSSYHRRVIHLTLQNDPLVQTHSKGEGEMKRVMVARRKNAS